MTGERHTTDTFQHPQNMQINIFSPSIYFAIKTQSHICIRQVSPSVRAQVCDCQPTAHIDPCLQMMIYHKTPNYHFLALGGWCRLVYQLSNCCHCIHPCIHLWFMIQISFLGGKHIYNNILIFCWRRIGIVFVPKMIQNGELIHKSVFGPSSNDINTALYHFSVLSDIL